MTASIDNIAVLQDTPVPIRMIRSIELGERLALTHIGEVFALDTEWVVKLFHAHIAFRDVLEEHRVAASVARLPLSVPSVQPEIVESLDTGRYGIVYGRAYGETMTNRLHRSPSQVFRQARSLAAQQMTMHELTAPSELPPMREKIAQRLARTTHLELHQRDCLLRVLDRLPEGGALCHGDLHLGNIIVGAAEPVLIDWCDASRGDRLCDVARSWITCRFNTFCTSWSLRQYTRLFAGAYLRAYLRNYAGDTRLLTAWQAVNAGARLDENISDYEIAMLKRYLQRVIAKLEL